MFGGESEAIGTGLRNPGGDGGLKAPTLTPFLHPKRVLGLLGLGERHVLGEGLAEVFAEGLWGELPNLG